MVKGSVRLAVLAHKLLVKGNIFLIITSLPSSYTGLAVAPIVWVQLVQTTDLSNPSTNDTPLLCLDFFFLILQ